MRWTTHNKNVICVYRDDVGKYYENGRDGDDVDDEMIVTMAMTIMGKC